MKIIVAGLSHKNTPIRIREKLAFNSLQIIAALSEFKNRFHESEFVLLSTCNRVELYCATKRDTGLTSENLLRLLSDFHNIPVEDFQDYLYLYNDGDAVRHLLTVASSLDSMVVGEAQIIGQVKKSYSLACSAKSTGKILNRLFHCAFFASKEVYTNTSISRGRISVAGVAIELAARLFADIASAKILVIGAGEMGQLLLQHLIHAGCTNIYVVNRSYEKALVLANHYKVDALNWQSLTKQLNDAGIVIASASGQDCLFRKKPFEEITAGRQKKNLLIIDIAVPRNFEPSISEIENVYLYSIDDLSEAAEQNLKAREDDIIAGMKIIEKNTAAFLDWLSAKDLGPLIGQMKEKLGSISPKELEQFVAKTGQKVSSEDSAEPTTDRTANKLLHRVIKNVNVVAKKQGPSEAAKLVDSIVHQAEELSGQTDRRP